jgi:hypothetical protein
MKISNLPFHPFLTVLHPAWSRMLLFSLAMSCAALAQKPNGSLEQGFANPPDSAKPRTWWHWISGNVTPEGITADLQAMKQIGLGGAQLFTVDQSQVKGPVVFLSPEWRKLVHQSLSEAADLHLEISMEGCDGWSESGGQWVTPKQAMQMVVWSEIHVNGGRTISLALPQPQTHNGYYADIALYAFPTLAGDNVPAPGAITTSASGTTPPKTPPTNANPIRFKIDATSSQTWVQYSYPKPVSLGSLQLNIEGLPRHNNKGELQVSDDGITFHKICSLDNIGHFDFTPISGKYFRVVFDTVKQAATVSFSEMTFGGPRYSKIPERTGMKTDTSLAFQETSFAPNQMIDPKALVDLTGKKEWNAPPGQWTLVRIGHTCTGATTHPSTTLGLECDKMSTAAVKSHIGNLYGPVWQDSPEQTGTTFRYILLDSWEAGCENWTPLMREEFCKRRGYDLQPWLPALTGRVILNPDATDRFLWDYRRTLADLVADNHYGTFQAEAHAHHMGLMSEAPGIGSPTVADGLQCKGRCDIPMGEFWVNQTGDSNVDDPRETASAAHIYGQNIAAAESYTAIPSASAWTNDPYSLKMEGDKEFCLGINRFVFHRYAEQPWLDRVPGMSMGPYGINFERTNTWWNQGSAWISYISRCQYLLQQGHFVADLLYFYGEGAPVFFKQGNLEPNVPPGYDYDACNAEILLNQMSVENGSIVLKSGMRYRVLVLPQTDRMTLPVLQKVAALLRDGATIYGPRPEKSPSLAGYPDCDQQLRSLAGEIWGDCDGIKVKKHAYGKGRIVWGKPLTDVLSVPRDFACDQPEALYIHRTTPEAEIYFVSNQTGIPRELQCTFRISGKMPELWHPDTGKIEIPALYRQQDGTTTLPIHFDPSGSVFVIFRYPVSGDAFVSMSRNGIPINQSGQAKITVQRAIYGAPNDPSRSADVRDKIQSLIDHGQTGIAVTSTLSSKGDPAPFIVKELNVTYTANGNTKTDTVREGDFFVPIAPSAALSFLHLNRQADGTVVLEARESGHYEAQTAENALQVADIPELPAPIQIQGPWQLEFQPHRGAPDKADFPDLMSWTDSPNNGIKYFSGMATYNTELTIPADYLLPGRHIYLDLGKVKNLAEVSLNGKPLGILWKEPFRVDITSAATAGSNQLQIKVTNLWPNRLIGDAKLPPEKRITWASVALYKADDRLLPSGLLGPVTVIPTAETKLKSK